MTLALQAVVSLNTSGMTAGMSSLQQTVTNATGAMAFAFGGVAAEVLAMNAAFGKTGATIALLKSAVVTGQSFEQQMQNVSSVTGIAGEELDKLAKAARDVARQTKFTATEAATALYSLGSAGIDTSENLVNALVPSLKLAGATMSETKLATETMLAAIKVFQLEFSDAGMVADIFAGAVAKSPATMERLADAMKFAGTAGASVGMSLSNVVQELAGFHQAGILGERAGTAFRRMIVDLQKRMLGFQGNIGNALQGWNAGTEGITGAVRRLEQAGLTTDDVFKELGKRTGPDLALLMKLGADAMDETSAKVRAAADVTTMYKTQLDSLQGAWKLFLSQLEEAQLIIFDKIVPALRAMVEWATSWAAKVNDMANPVLATSMKAFATALSLVIPALTQLKAIGLGVFDTLVDGVKSAVDWFNKLTPAVQGLIIAVPVIIAATTALLALKTAAIAFALTTIPKMIAGLAVFGKALFTNFILPITLAAAAMAAAIAGFSLGQTLGKIQTDFGTIGELIQNAIATYIIIFGGFFETLPMKWSVMLKSLQAFAVKHFSTMVKFFADMLGLMVDNVGGFTGNFLEAMGLDEAAEAVRKKLGGVADGFLEFDSKVKLEKTVDEMAKLQEGIKGVEDRVTQELSFAFNQMDKDLAESTQGGISNIKDFGAEFNKTLGGNAEAIGEAMSGAVGKVGEGFDAVKKFGKDFSNDVKNNMDKAGEGVDALNDKAKNVGKSVGDSMKDVADKIGKAMSLAGKSTTVSVSVNLPKITEKQITLWRSFFAIFANFGKGKVEFGVDIKLPRMTAALVKVWRNFFSIFARFGKGKVEFKIDIQLPKMTNAQVKVWRNFFSIFSKFGKGKTEFKVDIKLPAITNAQVKIWKNFFDALSGAGKVDLSNIGIDVSGGVGDSTNMSNMASDISAIKNWLQGAEGVLWA